MLPFKPLTLERPPIKKWIKDFLHCGKTRKEAKHLYKEYGEANIWANDIYQVIVNTSNPEYVWLSIKRHDKKVIFNWRDIQQIKNELIGSECEIVQLFPAESRKVDMVNQYHFYGFTDSTKRFPFGFEKREVSD